VKLWNSLRTWAGANATALRLCYDRRRASRLRVGQVVRTTTGLLGRIFSNHHHAGAVAGGAVGFIVPHQNVFSLGVALVIALVPLTLAAALWPSYRIAPLTAVIVLLTPGAQQLGPVGSAFYRIVQITLGSFVGLGVSLVLLPARAHGLVIGAATRARSASSPICLAIGSPCSRAVGAAPALRSCTMIS
jgi:hypothetical protein